MSEKFATPVGTGPSNAPFLLERRQFLILGSVAMVGFAAMPASAEGLAASTASSLPSRLDVGFVDGLYGEGIANAITGPSLVAAQSVTTGDPRFLSRTAKVTVLGMWRSADRRRDPISVTLKAYYPTSLSVGGDVPCFVWSHANRAVNEDPQRSRFLIPIDDAGLRLEVETAVPQRGSVVREGLRRRGVAIAAGDEGIAPRSRAAIAALANTASLSLGVEDKTTKLRPGMYVFALLPPGAAAADWQSVRYEPWKINASGGPVTGSGPLGDVPVSFDYIVVNVDFALP